MKFYFTFITLFLSIVSISQSEVDYLNNYLEETSEKLAVYKRNFTEVEEGIFRAEITYFNGTLNVFHYYWTKISL